jgi:hypothetical protein
LLLPLWCREHNGCAASPRKSAQPLAHFEMPGV